MQLFLYDLSDDVHLAFTAISDDKVGEGSVLLNHATVAPSDDLLHRRIVVGSRNGLDVVFTVVFSRGFHTFVDDASCHGIGAGDVRVIETFYLIRQFWQPQFVLEFASLDGSVSAPD